MCALGCFWLVSLSCWRNNCNNFSLRVAVLPPLFFYEYFSFFRLASSQLLTLPNYKSLQFFYNLLCFSFCIVCLCLSLHFICSFSLFFLFVLCPQLSCHFRAFQLFTANWGYECVVPFVCRFLYFLSLHEFCSFCYRFLSVVIYRLTWLRFAVPWVDDFSG